MRTIDSILGKSTGVADDADKKSSADLYAFAEPPETYRPSVIHPRPQMAFGVVEASGTMHGFMYHTLRHPKHQVRGGEEFLSFTADGIAVVVQGTGLRVVFLAMLRHVLVELREYDGKPIGDTATRITRLAIVDPQEKSQEAPVRLVK